MDENLIEKIIDEYNEIYKTSIAFKDSKADTDVISIIEMIKKDINDEKSGNKETVIKKTSR